MPDYIPGDGAHVHQAILQKLLALSCLASTLLLPTSGSALAVGSCDEYDSGEQVGTIEAEELNEVSGLVASHLNPGVYWTHNDSGNAPSLYAIDESGALLATYDVTGAAAIDWEDIALGPCPDEGCACLYIADMGDNLNARVTKTIYILPEPVLEEGATETARAQSIEFSYPDGRPDAETLLVDPRNGALFVVTKVSDGLSSVFKFPSNSPGETVTLDKVAEIEMSGSSSGSLLATGGDVASDGGRVIVRALDHAQEYKIPEGSALESAFESSPSMISLPDSSQGEAIAYEPDGTALMTVSENVPSPVYRVTCTSGTAISNPAEALELLCEDANGNCTARTGGFGRGLAGAIPFGGFLTLFTLALVGIGSRRRR